MRNINRAIRDPRQMGYIVVDTHEKMNEIYDLPPEERDAKLLEFLEESMKDAEAFARRQLREILDPK